MSLLSLSVWSNTTVLAAAIHSSSLTDYVMKTKLQRMTKSQMCTIINDVRGYTFTPDVWSKEELLNYLIDGGIYTSFQFKHLNKSQAN